MRRLPLLIAALACAVPMLFVSSTALGLTHTLTAPIALNQNGVDGEIRPVSDLGAVVDLALSTAGVDIINNDTVWFDVILNAGSASIDELGIFTANTAGLPGSGAGAALDAGQAPDAIAINFISFQAEFGFDASSASAANLEAGETSVRMFVTYPLLSLAAGNTASFMVSAGTNFTAQGTIVPEPSTALLLGIGLVGLAARRRSRQA